ncbi:hypothetical protein SAMN05216600_12940 [Pseudomonas cuatrocienegasensis]|uniref:Uncharacterized protein n=1 Tax=Pseudomonas cuatrocienegasensis TaxID=543360 RepID=A0ABY1BRC1_9PSED|nr:hypothetical protein SAMN05216600_12940 [Pseudomonas cuatrocienegasensis]
MSINNAKAHFVALEGKRHCPLAYKLACRFQRLVAQCMNRVHSSSVWTVSSLRPVVYVNSRPLAVTVLRITISDCAISAQAPNQRQTCCGQK